MTLKRTPGKWHWDLMKLDNGDERVIFADENNNEIHPTLGDLRLLEAAPEMYELLRIICKEFPIIAGDSRHDELWFAISKANYLLARIDGEQEKKS